VASSGSGFSDWYCYAYSLPEAPEEHATCGLSPGFESRFAGFLAFSLQQLPDLEFVQTALGTSVMDVKDLRAFATLRFKAKIAPGEPALPPGTLLTIRLQCRAPQTGGAPVSELRYHHDQEGIEVTAEWSSHALPLAKFREPWWQPALIDEGSCIERIQALEFVIEPVLETGEAAAGTLMLDDVYLE
jgi:hypothetical protein